MVHDEEVLWNEFRNVGLLWFVNRIIQIFGWSIFYDVCENNHNKKSEYIHGEPNFVDSPLMQKLMDSHV
ncbi:Uncharacterised protein [uncultured archaeon]|nr:Uncharacterised protein [uncultured archaeon]